MTSIWKSCLGLKNKDAILNAFDKINARNNRDDRFIPEDFIQYYMTLENPENKLQIKRLQNYICYVFELYDVEVQEKLEDFFYNLPTHDKVQSEMILKMREACGLGGK